MKHQLKILVTVQTLIYILTFLITTTSFFLLLPKISHADLTTGLEAYWALEETSGVRYDATSTNDLTDNNTVLATTGKNATSADIERSNTEYLSLADNTSIDYSQDNTFSAWVYLEAGHQQSTSHQLFGKYVDTTNRQVRFDFSNNVGTETWYLYTSTNGSTWLFDNVTTSDLSDDTWYHVVLTYDETAGTAELWLNGVSQGTFTGLSTNPYNTTSDFRLSRDSSGLAWDGGIDEVGFWSRILSDTEIGELYASGDGLFYPFSEPTPDPDPPTVSGVGLNGNVIGQECVYLTPTSTCSWIYGTGTVPIQVTSDDIVLVLSVIIFFLVFLWSGFMFASFKKMR